MSSNGTPAEGRQDLGHLIFVLGPALTLVAYTNAQGSLGDTTKYVDLIQPDQANGYGPIQLVNGSAWDATNGVCDYTHPHDPASNDGFGNPCWYPTGAWSAAVTGAALVTPDGVIRHYMDLPSPFVAAAGLKLGITISNLVAQG